MLSIQITPIGTIYSSCKEMTGTPIQAKVAEDSLGYIKIADAFIPALKDLEAFDRIWLLYHFNKLSHITKTQSSTYRDSRIHGIFASRAPMRPNHIGMSPVRLLSIEKNIINIADVDILDETPLIDIKPYIPWADHFNVIRCGWMDEIDDTRTRDDGRFNQ